MTRRLLLCGVILGSATWLQAETAANQTRIWVDSDPAGTERVLQALQAPLTSPGLDFSDKPLEEVVSYLRAEYELPIAIDSVGLDDVGIAPDELVTVNYSKITLGTALRELLRPLELTYAVGDGLLTITSEEEAAYNRLVTVVYPVRDMFGENPHYDDVIDVIVASIDSDIWAENGGGVSGLRVAPFRGALIVTAPTRTQTRVFELLRALRQSPLDPDAEPHWSNDPSVVREQSCEFQDPENPSEPTPAEPDQTGGGMF